MELTAVVVVPARDEETRIAQCLHALAAQTIAREAFEVVVVLDDCRDDTESVARQTADELGLALALVPGPGRGTGPARQAGMDLASRRLRDAGRPEGLIASTDADSRPAADWLERQLAHVARGARVIAGRIELDEREAGRLPPGVLRRRDETARARLHRVRRSDPDAAHHHFAGASIGVVASVYEAVGGIEPLPDLEDDGFAMRLTRHGIPIIRAADVVVTTSARTRGRATRGLSVDLALSDWSERRRFGVEGFSVSGLVGVKAGRRVCVIVPVKECAGSIGGVLERAVGPVVAAGLVDEVVVVDAGSVDGTAGVAVAAGARVVQQDEVCGELGPALGKGDAMWRALQVCGGEIVCFMDGDTRDPSPDHLVGLLGPLLTEAGVVMVRGSFERPLDTGQGVLAGEGGRVTELMARPLLNLYEPLLAGFCQPLAGEFAARREVLEGLAFPVGYGVEIATLIDTLRGYGLDAIAECRLGTRQNRHQSLRALGQMAYAVLAAVERRRAPHATDALPNGRYVMPWQPALQTATIPVQERPPIHEHRARRLLGASLGRPS